MQRTRMVALQKVFLNTYFSTAFEILRMNTAQKYKIIVYHTIYFWYDLCHTFHSKLSVIMSD